MTGADADPEELMSGAEARPLLPLGDKAYTPGADAASNGKNSSDASSAIALGGGYMVVGDDEANVLRIYPEAGGEAVYTWDYSAELGFAEGDEVDFEASTSLGNTLYLLGSHSNNKRGQVREHREVLFSVAVSGSGAETRFAHLHSYKELEQDLIAWDNSNAHGLGAGYFSLDASAGEGTIPEGVNGFSIEGMTVSLDGETLLLAFRAPLADTGTREKALLIGVTNFKTLLSATPPAAGASFSAPLELNLGGRGVRSIERAEDGSGYLIIAGPAGEASDAAAHNFRLFRWGGRADEAPVALEVLDEAGNSIALDALRDSTGGSFEAIVSPASVNTGTVVHLLQDNGDNPDYGKNAPTAQQKFVGNVLRLGEAVLDRAAPVLVSAPTTAVVPANATLVFSFDEGIKRGEACTESGIVLRDADNNPIAVEISIHYNVLALKPVAALAAGASYTVRLGENALTDHHGNAVAAGEWPVMVSSPESRPSLLITEVNSKSARGDFFKLYNHGESRLDLSGWKVRDAGQPAADGSQSVLPPGTVRSGWRACGRPQDR